MVNIINRTFLASTRNIRAKKTRAFTLIELSIVLVIIGLIVGGVLVGQDLIEGAKMRKQVTQLKQYDQAVYTFRLKYEALPGDMKLADAARFGLPHLSYGQTGSWNFHNGNKKLSHYNGGCSGPSSLAFGGIHNPNHLCAFAVLGEPHYFFMQLNGAGLIKFTPGTNPSILSTALPPLISGQGQVFAGHTRFGPNGYYLGAGSSGGGNHFLGTNSSAGSFTADFAQRFDVKFDDGLPNSGQVKAVYFRTGTNVLFEDWGPEGSYTRNCTTGANNNGTYDLATSPGTKECQLWVQAAW